MFAGGPLIPAFAKVPAETGYECWNRATSHQLNEAPRVRRRFAGARSAAAFGSVSAPILRNAASAARSPLSQAPSTVPHKVSCVASPARNRLPRGSVRILREPCPPGAATDIAPSVKGDAFHRVTLDLFAVAAISPPNNFFSHSCAKATIALSP